MGRNNVQNKFYEFLPKSSITLNSHDQAISINITTITVLTVLKAAWVISYSPRIYWSGKSSSKTFFVKGILTKIHNSTTVSKI